MALMMLGRMMDGGDAGACDGGCDDDAGIYDDAGAPGAQAFRFAVRRAGLQISDVEAKAFVAQQSTGQAIKQEIRQRMK